MYCSVRNERAPLLFPALWIAEHDTKYTSVATSRLVKQDRPVELTKLASNEEAQPGTTLAAGEKGLKDSISGLRVDAGAAVGHFEIRPVAGAQTAELDFNADAVPGLAVLDRVFTQIPNHLV